VLPLHHQAQLGWPNSNRQSRLEATIPWSQATWGAAPLHPVSQSERLDLNQRSPGPQPVAIPGFATLCRHRMTRLGFEPNLASLPFSIAERGWQPHQKSNGPCVWTYLFCVPVNRIVLEVGWRALESGHRPQGGPPGLQPDAKPSQLPAHLCALHAFSATKKPGVFCVTPGFLKARGRLKADVTCAGDTEILRYANLYSPNCQQMDAENRAARVALRADSPRSLTDRRRTLWYRSVCNRTSAGKAS
jgi:hypothetical protein